MCGKSSPYRLVHVSFTPGFSPVANLPKRDEPFQRFSSDLVERLPGFGDSGEEKTVKTVAELYSLCYAPIPMQPRWG
jgi:hypothetical protein